MNPLLTPLRIGVRFTDMKSAVPRRPYTSTRRAEAAARTRELILEAVAKGLADGGMDAVSFESIAQHAGIAARTVYRHFPTRERLLTAFWDWLMERLDFKDYPRTEQELLSAVPRVFAMMDRNERLVRSYLASQLIREIRQPVEPQRNRDISRCIAGATAGLPEREIQRAIAVIQALFSAPVWQVMRDRVGLTGKQAGEAVSWTIEVLLRELHIRRRVSERDNDDVP